MTVTVFYISGVDHGLVGMEGAGYTYHVSGMVDSDEELDDLVQDEWGVPVHSDADEGLSDVTTDDEDNRSIPSSPPPDDTKSKGPFTPCENKSESNRTIKKDSPLARPRT